MIPKAKIQPNYTPRLLLTDEKTSRLLPSVIAEGSRKNIRRERLKWRRRAAVGDAYMDNTAPLHPARQHMLRIKDSDLQTGRRRAQTAAA